MPQELQGDIRIQVKCAVEQPAIRRQNDNQRKRYDRADQQRPDEPIQACSLQPCCNSCGERNSGQRCLHNGCALVTRPEFGQGNSNVA